MRISTHAGRPQTPLVGEDNGGIFEFYVSVTLGANAIGLPAGNNANSFIDSAFLSFDFASAFSKDYSMGVAGTVALVPEPSSLALTGLGAAVLVGFAWRRRKVA